jgi:hypothetical protein
VNIDTKVNRVSSMGAAVSSGPQRKKLIQKWRSKTIGGSSVWLFYNNGRNLYCAPGGDQNRVYDESFWQFLPFRDYMRGKTQTSVNGQHELFIKTRGHTGAYHDTIISVGTPDEMIFVIPPLHILRIAVSTVGIHPVALTVFQPLKVRLVPLVGPQGVVDLNLYSKG